MVTASNMCDTRYANSLCGVKFISVVDKLYLKGVKI